MLKNENIICISSIDWDFVWQGHQEIMSTFARNGNRVLFIENTGIRRPTFRDIPRLKKRFINWFKSIQGFREEAKNLFVYSPIFLPFPYSKLARRISKYMMLNPLRRWMKTMEFYEPIIWTFLPTGIALDIINNIDRKLLVYYCIADFYELAGSPKKVRKTENALIRKSDLIFVQGEALKEKCNCLSDKVYIFPFGVRIEAFENFQRNCDNEAPDDIRNIKRPVIGYIGGIHKHIDFALIKFVAKVHPEWSIVLIGPIQTDASEINNLDNVFLLGQKDFSSLPNYISHFDVGIVPYDMSEYTQTVFPTKLNEYQVMGRPVVSSALPEIDRFNEKYGKIVYAAKSKEDFVECIKFAINEDNERLRKRRIEVAKENSWESRIRQMSNLIEAEVGRKKADREARWKENFLRFYRVSRRRLLRLGAICLLIYFLLFQTPLLWLLAAPLKISQPPQQADVIVVFGGGVGEGGSPGKSTIERARRAAKLYNDGYANRVIFSSGYTYKYNDAENMKLFALSAGVPQKNIILEQKANSTYENVKFTKEIIDSNNWNSILLVSSPYNMRRASLVFKKLDKNLKIIYTPVIEPQFYHRERKIKWEQVKAIAHEYLGIIYYWWKRYI